MKKTIEKFYQFTQSECPVWQLSRTISTKVFAFEVIDPKNGKTIGTTNLIWRYDSHDADWGGEPLYHGCKYRFTGYCNPLPVTDWFRGVPLKQMLKWCYDHGLVGGECISHNIHLTYKDVSATNRFEDDDEVF